MSDSNAPPRGRLRERTAEEIRVILARRRMSAAELARKTGIRQQNLSRRMTGETAFDLDDLEVIAAALGVKVTDLIGGDVSHTDPQATGGKLRLTDQRPGGTVRPTSQGSPTRPRDGRPKGRPAGSVPNPHTRRPARIPSIGRDVASAA